MKSHWDVLVLGGGILGVTVAVLAREKGKSVLVARLRDDERAEADTLRAQGVLHSGLLYAKFNRALALQIRAQGERLLKFGRIAIPSERGIYILESERQADEFTKAAADIKILSQIRRLDDSEAQVRLGAFYVPGFPALEVPDVPFPSAQLLENLREIARHRGADFIEVDDEVEIVPDKTQENGFLCQVKGRPLSASNVVLATGVRLIKSLNRLGIPHQLRVSSTPVLRIEGGDDVHAGLIADFRSRTGVTGNAPLFITRHLPETVPPKGCLVLAGSRKPLAESEITTREVDWLQQEFLKSGIPQAYSSAPQRWWAGHKIEPKGAIADHWVLPTTDHNYKGLFAAVPGKAIMALSVAEDIFQQIEGPSCSANNTPERSAANFDLPPSQAWQKPVRMMHDGHYNNIDEAKNMSSPGNAYEQ